MVGVIKDIMVDNVKTIDKKKSVFEAASVMSDNSISCLVVMESDNIAGIITLKDIIDKVVVKRRNTEEVTVEMIMTTPVKTVEKTRDIVVAAGTMKAMNIKQLPIVDNGKLVGIVTQTDLIKNHQSIFGC